MKTAEREKQTERHWQWLQLTLLNSHLSTGERWEALLYRKYH